jgi:hypothetical protein
MRIYGSKLSAYLTRGGMLGSQPRAGYATRSKLLLWNMLPALLLLAGCSDRPRDNPLDPENSKTAGRPTGVTAISILDTINVRWDALRLRDLTGFNVYRQRAGEADFSLLANLGPQQNRFVDATVRYGVAHSYRVTARVNDFESPPSASATIVPGPTLTWVADFDDRSIVKLSHDGQREISRARLLLPPFRLAVDKQRGSVWALLTDRPSPASGKLARFDLNGKPLGSFGQFPGMVDLALDDTDGSVWVADSLGEGLIRFDHEGRHVAQHKNVPKISALAYNRFTRELWALTGRDGQLLSVASQPVVDTLRIAIQSFVRGRPLAIDIDNTTGAAWMAFADSVIRVDVNGNNRLKVKASFRFASHVAVDQLTGECWVIDQSLDFFRDSRVLKLGPGGDMVFEVNGLDRPQALAVNPFDSSCYVADTLRGRTVMISKTGAVLPGFHDLITPFDIEVVAFSN